MPAPRYDLEDRLINFAVQICLLTDRFPSTPIAKHDSSQTTRSGTSPFANYGEAFAASIKTAGRKCKMSNVEYPISKFVIGYWTLDIL